MDLEVTCHAGYRADEYPVRFTLNGRTIEVAGELSRWNTPDHRYFKVRGGDGGCYTLRQDVRGGEWDLAELGR